MFIVVATRQWWNLLWGICTISVGSLSFYETTTKFLVIDIIIIAEPFDETIGCFDRICSFQPKNFNVTVKGLLDHTWTLWQNVSWYCTTVMELAEAIGNIKSINEMDFADKADLITLPINAYH